MRAGARIAGGSSPGRIWTFSEMRMYGWVFGTISATGSPETLPERSRGFGFMTFPRRAICRQPPEQPPPYRGEPQFLGRTCAGHGASPCHCLATSEDHEILFGTRVLDPSLILAITRKPESIIANTSVLFASWFNGFVTTKSSDHNMASR